MSDALRNDFSQKNSIFIKFRQLLFPKVQNIASSESTLHLKYSSKHFFIIGME